MYFNLALIFVRHNLNTKIKCNKIIYRFYMYEYMPVYLYINEDIYNINTPVTLFKPNQIYFLNIVNVLKISGNLNIFMMSIKAIGLLY